MSKIPEDEYDGWTKTELQNLFNDGWITKGELKNALSIKNKREKKLSKRKKKK